MKPSASATLAAPGQFLMCQELRYKALDPKDLPDTEPDRGRLKPGFPMALKPRPFIGHQESKSVDRLVPKIVIIPIRNGAYLYIMSKLAVS